LIGGILLLVIGLLWVLVEEGEEMLLEFDEIFSEGEAIVVD
jgi:hypothetical protein